MAQRHDAIKTIFIHSQLSSKLLQDVSIILPYHFNVKYAATFSKIITCRYII